MSLRPAEPEGNTVADPKGHPRPDPSASSAALFRYVDISRLTGLSERTLKRRNATGDIPGAFHCGRQIFFHADIIRRWIAAGMPDGKRANAGRRHV